MLPRMYIYFNGPEVNRLYAQITGWVPAERVKEASHKIEGGFSAGIIGIGAKGSGAKESGTREQSKISEEQKLQDIESCLRENNQLSNDISEAVTYVLRNNIGIFVRARHYFDAPEFRDSTAPVESINKSGCVTLECIVDSTGILISLGLDHMTRVRNCNMSRTGHDAIVFRELRGREIPLEIFGFLHPIESKIQIRPITVSL